MKKQQSAQQGFALVVVSAIFIAFSIVAAAFIDRTNATQQITQQEQARAQLTRISNALLQYYSFNNNLFPCPADTAVLPTAAHYGTQVANCATNNVGVNLLSNTSPFTNEVISGMVPFKALVPYGVSPEDVIDPWNNRIMYVINRKLTIPGGASSLTVFPEVIDNLTGETYRTPDFIIISYGRDGMGATPKNSTNVAVTCPATSSTLRQRNCDSDLRFAQGPLVTSTSTPNALYYDDLISFYSVSPTPCIRQNLTWGSTCAGDFMTTASGFSRQATNYNSGSTGSATAACTNGVFAAPSGTCVSSGTTVNGACGSANNGSFLFTPDVNLCSNGEPSWVSESAGKYQWTCNGNAGGTTASCSATPVCECYGTNLTCASPHNPRAGTDPITSAAMGC